MRLGYHYHVPVVVDKGVIHIQSYIGVFLNALADNVDELVLFLHEESAATPKGYDFTELKSNIRLVSLGKKTPAWDRLLFPGKYLSRMQTELKKCDAILLRSPSPLSPAIQGAFKNNLKCVFLLVGDYAAGLKHMVQPWYRAWAIKLLMGRNQRQLDKALTGHQILVNSIGLQQKYRQTASEISMVNTSSITDADFFKRTDTCTDSEIRLLFTGRFDYAKGLAELLDAVHLLRSKNHNVSVQLVGWEDYPEKPVEQFLKQKAETLGIADSVVFHGKKSVGPELNAMYRQSDIYVLPSYFEGFPRTIWEAFANSLPVVTTPVGGIPHILTDGQEVVFCRVKDPEDLAEKIEQLITNADLRKTLIERGWLKARDVRLEVQGKRIVDFIKNFTN